MTIDELIEGLPVELVRGSLQTPIRTLVEDSRRAGPGCLFVARRGTVTDGRRFIADAVAAGASAVLTEPATDVPEPAAVLATADVPVAAARLAERIHGDPSRRLRLVGITGTNGKTTTSFLIHQVLNRTGTRCGLIGTVLIDDGSAAVPADLTTPPAFELSRMLAAMVAHGCGACVMEVSSHALQQRRAAGLAFDAAVFTNLTGDHADYHGTMDAYAAAKARLFETIPADGWVVVNIDDPAAQRMTRDCAARVVTCSLSDDGAAYTAKVHRQTIRAADITIHGPAGAIRVTLPLVGLHNVANALQAFAVCCELGFAPEVVAAALGECHAPPGRLEPVAEAEALGFAVLVDYAHTDDALENVLSALRPLVLPPARLRTVFGCGGDRDRTKRPRMAAAACRWSDDVIVTSDNPRTEDPVTIIDGVMAGISARHRDAALRIADRAEAIAAAIERAEPGDVVLIAGKGHEDYQIIGHEKRPFDDRAVARQAIAARRAEVAAR